MRIPIVKWTNRPSRSCLSPMVLSIFRKKQPSFPPRNTEGTQNPRSEWSPGKWTSQTKVKNQTLFFQDKNTTSKKKGRWTDHICTLNTGVPTGYLVGGWTQRSPMNVHLGVAEMLEIWDILTIQGCYCWVWVSVLSASVYLSYSANQVRATQT